MQSRRKSADVTTRVVFRRYPHGEIIALFPDIPWNRQGEVTSYMHLGQHGAADYAHVIAATESATDAECEPLLNELRQVGYDNLCIVRDTKAKEMKSESSDIDTAAGHRRNEMVQTLGSTLSELANRFVTELSRLPLRPDGWLPHVVYVEEQGDYYPIYTRYNLEEIRNDGSCVLFNPETAERYNDRRLYEINIDWLDTVLRWYYECCTIQHLDREHLLAVLSRETDADQTTITEFLDDCLPERFALETAVIRFHEWLSASRPPFRVHEMVRLTDEAIAAVRELCGNDAADD